MDEYLLPYDSGYQVVCEGPTSIITVGSVWEASRKFGIDVGKIIECCRGYTSEAEGICFRYSIKNKNPGEQQ